MSQTDSHSHSHSPHHSNSKDDTAHFSTISQSSYHATAPDGSTSTVTTTGNLVQSSDPSVRPDAKFTQKLTGDVKGAFSGTIGSLEAATGAAFRNEGMEEKGLEKMAREDERLGAKRGVMPVGSERRESTKDVEGEEGKKE